MLRNHGYVFEARWRATVLSLASRKKESESTARAADSARGIRVARACAELVITIVCSS
jgi:hypothetical protein